MHCDGCERELPDNAKFCPACGKASTQTPTAVPPAEQPSTAVVAARRSPLVPLMAALLVLLAAGCLAWFIFFRGSCPDARRETPVATLPERQVTPPDTAGGGESISPPAADRGSTAAPRETAGRGDEEAGSSARTQPTQAGVSRQDAGAAAVPSAPAKATEAAEPSKPSPKALPPCKEQICIEVSEATCSPDVAAPGSKVSCSALYSLVQRIDKEPVEIEESAQFDGERRPAASQRMQRRSGYHRLTISFTVPKDLKKGAHRLVLKARRRGVSGSAKASLKVER